MKKPFIFSNFYLVTALVITQNTTQSIPLIAGLVFIFAGFLLPVAQAETVLYGQIQGSIDYVRNDNPNGASLAAFQVASPLSFFGIRGQKKISEQLTAVYDLQNTFSFSSQSTARNQLAGRIASVGLMGSFGSVLLGKNVTPFRYVQMRFELFNRHVLGDFTALTHLPKDTSNQPWDRVSPDTITYLTPRQWQRFSARVMYKPDEADGDLQSDWLSAALFYKNQGLLLGLGYEVQPEILDNFGNAERATGIRLAASYQRQSWRFIGFYQQTDFAAIRDQVYGLGSSYTRGKNTFKAHYFIADNELADRDAALFALGIDHRLSRRTTVYVSYAVLNNQDQQNYSVISAGHGREGIALPGFGGQSAAWSLGLTHLF